VLSFIGRWWVNERENAGNAAQPAALTALATSAPFDPHHHAGKARAMSDHANAAIDEFPHTVESSRAWMDTAAQFSRNEDYYRGLVVQIGEMLGDPAFTDDAGELHDSVLCAKVPALVREALAKRSRPMFESEALGNLSQRN
jgi:hypothetical protein